MPLSLDELLDGARSRAQLAVEALQTQGRTRGHGHRHGGRASTCAARDPQRPPRLPDVLGLRHRRPARRARLRRRHRGAASAAATAWSTDGIELAEAIDAFAREHDVRSRQGAWGVLTRRPLRPHALLRDRAHQRPRPVLQRGRLRMNRFSRPGSGWIEVITGSMFSGKSEELIRRVRRAQIARQRVQIFKPQVDDRYASRPHRQPLRHEAAVAGREAARRRSCSASTTAPRSSGSTKGSSSTPGSWPVANTLADRGVRVIVAGLDQDYMGRPFEPMPQILAVAEYVDKTLAICMQCGAPANRTPAPRRARRTASWWGGRRSTKRAAGAASSHDPDGGR